jgi:sulfate adenylyltransferase
MVPFNMMVYLEDHDKYVPDNEVRNGARVLNISGTELRQGLNEGREIPGWFTYPEVVQELRRSYPPRHLQGLTIFFTGLSGSGKSTIANVLLTKFLEMGGRPVTSSTATWFANSCLRSLASPRSTATLISSISSGLRRLRDHQ